MKFLLYIILTVLVAWLVAHPNAVGRAGVLLNGYGFIGSFPAALLSVGASVALAIALSITAQKILSPRVAVVCHAVLLVIAVVTLMGIFVKFSAGSYALTGKGFRWGLHLWPCVMILVFLQGFYEIFRTGKLHK